MKYHVPQDVEVCGYQDPSVYRHMMRNNHVEPTSPFFRCFMELGLALQKAVENSGGKVLQVISAGCSFGSEIDTGLKPVESDYDSLFAFQRIG